MGGAHLCLFAPFFSSYVLGWQRKGKKMFSKHCSVVFGAALGTLMGKFSCHFSTVKFWSSILLFKYLATITVCLFLFRSQSCGLTFYLCLKLPCDFVLRNFGESCPFTCVTFQSTQHFSKATSKKWDVLILTSIPGNQVVSDSVWKKCIFKKPH